jgi:cob(I)alamin adenosyltransferase
MARDTDVEVKTAGNPEGRSSDRNTVHRKKMQKLKTRVDAGIAAANTEQGVLVLLTGDGKGKSSSAFGMVMRSLGYGYKVGVVQFIKGEQLSGEELYLQEHCPEVSLYQMGTGYTWDTQNREADIAAARETWAKAAAMLKKENFHLVVLDELTYMLGLGYLDEDEVLAALQNRPTMQSVVVTGRGGGTRLQELADTVSEVKSVRHAYEAGIKARRGVDY